MAKGLIFIPDISGFTSFVNNTEISHQHHILEELLDLLIETNDLDLDLAEIEGDALFFVKDGSLPELSSVLELCEKMYLRFHNHLRYYDSRRLCHCGACQNATGLTLKFIIHFGEISYLKLKNRDPKPHGINVIIAHRMLKNEVPSNEYILVTNTSISNVGELQTEGNSWIPKVQEFGDQDVGKVEYHYSDLVGLKNKIEEPEKIRFSYQSKRPVKHEVTVVGEPVDVFEAVINHKKRVDWNPFIDDILADDKELNQVGQDHTCIIQGNENQVTTVTSDFGKDSWVLGEKGNLPPIGDLYTYIVIKPSTSGTSKVIFEAHPNPNTLVGKLFLPLIKFKMAQFQKDMGAALKSYLNDKSNNFL